MELCQVTLYVLLQMVCFEYFLQFQIFRLPFLRNGQFHWLYSELFLVSFLVY